MNREELDKFLLDRDFTVDGGHFPHANSNNKFCDLYVGIGHDYPELARLKTELNSKLPNKVIVTMVTNPNHKDFGKMMVEIKSYWNE